MNRHFEDYLGFIETQMSVELLGWQRVILREHYEKPKRYYCINRWSDMHWCYEALRLLSEEMERDNGILPWLYKPDGYTTDMVVYDEGWSENTEWKKEKEL
jgi:hypothetical protein